MAKINQIYVKSHAQGGEGNRDSYLELHFTAKSKKQKTSENQVMLGIIFMTELLGKNKIGWMDLAKISSNREKISS